MHMLAKITGAALRFLESSGKCGSVRKTPRNECKLRQLAGVGGPRGTPRIDGERGGMPAQGETEVDWNCARQLFRAANP